MAIRKILVISSAHRRRRRKVLPISSTLHRRRRKLLATSTARRRRRRKILAIFSTLHRRRRKVLAICSARRRRRRKFLAISSARRRRGRKILIYFAVAPQAPKENFGDSICVPQNGRSWRYWVKNNAWRDAAKRTHILPPTASISLQTHLKLTLSNGRKTRPPDFRTPNSLAYRHPPPLFEEKKARAFFGVMRVLTYSWCERAQKCVGEIA